MERTSKNKSRTKILSLALTVAVLTGSVLSGGQMVAQAAEVQAGLPTIVVSTTTTPITESPTVVGFGGKKWVVIGHNGTGVNSEADTMTLLLRVGTKSTDNSYGTTMFDSTNPYNNEYATSDLKTAMNNAANVLPAGEKAMIVPVDLEGGSANGGGATPDDRMAGATVIDQLFWPLSVSETNAIRRNEHGFYGYWWLRSAGNVTSKAAIAYTNGGVSAQGMDVNKPYSIRPAFKINLKSVIFSSSNLDGKPKQVGANLSATGQPTAGIKFTIKEIDTSKLDLKIADTSARTAVPGETISIPYTGAVAGTDKSVSCVVEDSRGVQYYAKLATAVNGTAYIKVPADMPIGNYTLKLFNEQDKGDNYTDFASAPISIPLTVETPESPTVTPSNLTIQESTTGSLAVALGTGTDKATSVSIESDNTSVATVNTPSLAANGTVIVTGVAEGRTTVTLGWSGGDKDGTTTTVVVAVNPTPITPTVTPTNLMIQQGTTGSFAVTMGTGTDNASSVSIVSDNTAVATVDTPRLTANGTVTVTGVAEGRATVTLGWSGGDKDGTTTTVAVAVSATPIVPTVTPTNLTIQEGTTGSLAVALGTGTDKATSVRIVSDNTAVATVDTPRLYANDAVTVTGVAVGTATITLKWTGGSKDGTTTTVAVTVSPPTALSPTVSPTNLTFQKGTTGRFAVALGTGTDKANSVSIVSDNPAVATVDTPNLAANGTVTVTGVAVGTATINLKWTGGGKDGTTTAVAVTVSTTTTSSPTVVGFGGKLWVVIGHNGTGVNSEVGTMTLLLKAGVNATDNSYGFTKFDAKIPYSNQYNGSDLNIAMDYVATTVPLEEQSLIVKTNLSDVAAVDQLFWPLSVSEASAIHANELKFSRDWWLRSAGLNASGAVFVNLNGIVFPDGGSVTSVGSIRPAFKVNLESVIFSPSDLGRKPTTVGADLTAAVPNTDAVKLTVKETNPANLNLTIADISAIGAMPGETVSIDYTGAVESTAIAPNKYVSCVVEDSNGAIKYYAKLETAANGTAYITIPADMPPGNYKIRLFNEQCNADNYTDFASNPIDISLTVESSPTIDDSATGTDSINLTEGYGAYTKTYTIAGFPAPKVAVTSDGGTGATATTTGELTIPTGLTKGNYTVVLTASNGHLPNATMTVAVNVSKTPSYTGRSSSSGGSSTVDTRIVVGRVFTKPAATRLFNTALAAKLEGQTTLSLRARNYTSADKSAFTELAALAHKNGVTVTVHFDTVAGKAVAYRLSVNPAVVTTNLDLTAKIVGGKITLPKFAVPVEVAVKLPAGLTMENLKITENGKDITAATKPWLDKNGYVHFKTKGGEIVISN